MKKVLYVICALFVSVAFGSVALADHEYVKPGPKDNTVKTTPTDNSVKMPEKK